MTGIHPLFVVAFIALLGWLGLAGIKTLLRSRSHLARLSSFTIGFVLFLALTGGTSWMLFKAAQTGVISCPGTRCGGSAALASEPNLYWVFFSFYAVSAVAFLAMAFLSLIAAAKALRSEA